MRVSLWGQPGAIAATYRTRKGAQENRAQAMLVPNSGMVVILIHSIAFYTVFLGNMVSVLFREIHTEKCKKLLFFFSFVCSCSWKRCKTPYLPTAHSSENAAGEHS